MKDVRIRFGIKDMPLFRNAGIFVLYLDEDKASKLIQLIDQARTVVAYKYPELGNRLVCERSGAK